MENLSMLATLVLAGGVVSLLCLLVLHFVSPEFAPSWRMVSEYALGKHKWLLTIFFFAWGISSMLLCVVLLGVVTSVWAKIGVLLLFVSGVGAIMGGLFDVKHNLHGLSFALGVPTLIVGSLLISYHLAGTGNWDLYRVPVLFSAHLVWISCVLMGGSMALMFSGFKKAGVAWDKDAPPPTSVPPGVIAVGGYANRFLVLCYVGWHLLIAWVYLQVS